MFSKNHEHGQRSYFFIVVVSVENQMAPNLNNNGKKSFTSISCNKIKRARIVIFKGYFSISNSIPTWIHTYAHAHIAKNGLAAKRRKKTTMHLLI